MKKILLLFAILLCTTSVFAQVLEGIVKDAKTNESLAYVNIGLIGKTNGTVTDDNGRFKLTLNNNGADSLRISMIGYKAQTFLVKDFTTQYNPGATILLTPAVHELAEVKVSNRKVKQVVLGNTTESKSADAGFTSNQLGNEIGAIIKIKKSPTYLRQFNAALAHPAADSVKLRLNFYSVKNGLPDKILQQENIFVTVKRGQEKITVDLTPYTIFVTDRFFVSLECIQKTRGPGLMFSASLFSSAIIARETSQSNWEKTGIAGVGFNVLAEY